MTFSKRLFKGAATAFLAAAVLAAFTPLLFIDSPSVFELDGNAVTDLGSGGDDWANAAGTGSGLGHAVATSAPQNNIEITPGWPFVINDPVGYTIFGGGSKDTLDIGQNTYTSGSVPPKDELGHGFAAAYQVNTGTASTQPHTFIYFGADRISTNGDSNIGIWFLQNSITSNGIANSKTNFTGAPCPAGATNCTPGDLHRDNDVFIVSAFTQGGAIGTIQVYHWDHTVSGGLVLDDNQNASQCTSSSPSHSLVCAVINTTNQKAPWPFSSTDSGVPPQTFDPGSFFEGGFDLTQLFINLGKPQPCFSAFLEETRSSQSLTATLKDFVLGSFQLCSISASKACSNTPTAPPQILSENGATYVRYTFTATVTNTGAGEVFSPTITDVFPSDSINWVVGGTPCASATCKVTIPTGTSDNGITSGQSASISGTFDVPTDQDRSNSLGSATVVGATASPSSGGSQTVIASNVPLSAVFGPDSPVGACHVATNPMLKLYKSCAVGLVAGSSGVVLQLQDAIEVCNVSPDTTTVISGITLNNNVAGFGATNAVGGTITLPPGTDPGDQTTFIQTPTPTAAPVIPTNCKLIQPVYTPTSCSAGGPTLTGGRCQFTDTVSINSVPTDEFGQNISASTIPGPVVANQGQGCNVCPYGSCTLSGQQ
jgi:hypothetical protein